MNQKKELIKNTAIIAIGKLSTQVLSFLLLPLYTAKLSTSEYGNYDFLVTISVFLLPIITLLMEESMFRFLIDSDDKDSKKRVITQTILYTVVGTVIFTILGFLAMWILNIISNGSSAPLGGDDSVWHLLAKSGHIFIIFVISNILIGLSNSLARGLGQIKLYSLSNFVLGALTILFVKAGCIGLLLANTIANTITALYIFYKLNFGKYFSKKSKDSKLMNEMIRYSVPLVPNTLSWIIINLSDRLIINTCMGSDANGVYSIANKFPNILYTVYGFFSTAWKESAARIIKEDNKTAYYNSIYHDLRRFLFAVVLCLIAVMPFVFPILVSGNSYNEAYIHIPLLVLATYYTNLSNFYGGIFAAFKNTKIMGNTTIVAAIINIVINIALIKYIGLYAAVLSTFIANVIIYWYRKRALNLYIKLKETKKIASAIILALVVLCYYSNNWIAKVAGLIIAIAYAILVNQKFIIIIKDKVLGMLHKSKDI